MLLPCIRDSVEAKFSTYTTLVEAVATGSIRFLTVFGSPGLGKTFEAKATLERSPAKHTLTRTSGHITPLALYSSLFAHRTIQDVLMFDDCDDVFKNKDCMNILKAAADTHHPRTISWESSSAKVPAPKFQFAGRIILITNVPALDEAIADRAHCFELALTKDERLYRVLSVLHTIAKTELIFSKVAGWIVHNADKLYTLGRLTIRSAIKACELSRISTFEWEEYAELTLLNGNWRQP